jgi:hypothetical protein
MEEAAVLEGAEVFAGEGGVQDMDLSCFPELQNRGPEDIFQGWKILEGCREDDGVETKALHDAGIEVAAHELEIGLVTKHPCCLLQYLEVPVEAQDAMAGDGRQLMGKPSISAAYFQDAKRLFFKGQIVHQPLTGFFAQLPMLVQRVRFRQVGQFLHFFIREAPYAVALVARMQREPAMGEVQAGDVDIIRLDAHSLLYG